MLELIKRQKVSAYVPPKIIRSSSFADSVLFSQIAIQDNNAPKRKTSSSGTKYRNRSMTDEDEQQRKKEKKMVFTSCTQIYVSLLSQAAKKCKEAHSRDSGHNICPEEIQLISNLLGLEDNLELEDEEAFVDVKLELAKTTILYLVDSPAPTGLLLVDAFTRLNPEFPWQVAFQMMATRNSEAIQIEGIKMLTLLYHYHQRKIRRMIDGVVVAI